MPLQMEAEKGTGLSIDPRPPLHEWCRRNLDSARGGVLSIITCGEMAEKRWKPQNPGFMLLPASGSALSP